MPADALIGIVDYQINNLRSVQKAFEVVGARSFVSSDPRELARAEKLVLPGVGAFGKAMENLGRLGLREVIEHHVASGRPLIGICLGMQLLYTRSHEQGVHEGFGFIDGDVRVFPSGVKVPHIGWNEIDIVSASPILEGVEEGSYAYFVHSYYADPSAAVTLATTEYGVTFSSVIGKSRIYGIQFHPEKSQIAGFRILKNFSRL